MVMLQNGAGAYHFQSQSVTVWPSMSVMGMRMKCRSTNDTYLEPDSEVRVGK